MKVLGANDFHFETKQSKQVMLRVPAVRLSSVFFLWPEMMLTFRRWGNA